MEKQKSKTEKKRTQEKKKQSSKMNWKQQNLNGGGLEVKSIAEVEQHEDTALKTAMREFAEVLLPFMSGNMEQKDRVREAFHIVQEAVTVSKEDVRKVEAVLYAMADKFLKKEELEEIAEEISMTELGKMLVNKGISQGISQGINQGISQNKIENARNLLDVLDVQTIAEKIGLPLETVEQLKNKKAKISKA